MIIKINVIEPQLDEQRLKMAAGFTVEEKRKFYYKPSIHLDKFFQKDSCESDDIKIYGEIIEYLIMKKLGKGLWGEVYHCVDELGKSVVIKISKDGEEAYDLLKIEVKALSKIKTLEIRGIPIIQSSGIISDEREMGITKPAIIQECLIGEPLNKWISHYCEKNEETDDKISVRKMAGNYVVKEVLKILKLVHEKGIIHTDISPDNIIVSGDEVILIDWGLALDIGDEICNEKFELESAGQYHDFQKVIEVWMGIVFGINCRYPWVPETDDEPLKITKDEWLLTCPDFDIEILRNIMDKLTGEKPIEFMWPF